jgi:hypothetical protein
MQIDRFAGIIAALVGLGGVMCVLKDVSRLSPDLIAKVA